MQCPACGASNRDGAAFCLTCRATIPASDAVAHPAPSGAPEVDTSWGVPYYDRDPGVIPAPAFAGFWARAFALLLDNVFALLLAIPPLLALFLLGVWLTSEQQAAPATRGQRTAVHDGLALTLTFAAVAVFLVVAFIYHVIMTARGGGWGMRIMGIRIVRADNGENPGYGRAIGRLVTRSVFGFIPVVGSVAQFLDNLWMIWDGKKQTWHDKAAGTYVVRR